MHNIYPFIEPTSIRRTRTPAARSTLITRRDMGRAKLLVCVAALCALALLPWQGDVASALSGWQWYKADTHVHSSISSDGFADLGIYSQAASLGYNALFITDHDGGSNYVASTNYTANHVVFEDNYTGWSRSTYGSLSATTNAITGSKHHTGSNSVHLTSSSTNYGETYITTQRGPNFRGGNITITFWVYPVRIDPGSGLDVSVSIGGDPTVQRVPTGYTTQSGVVSPGKSTVLVWQLGNTRQPSTDPNARVLTYSLGNYTLNAWNSYTINVTQALADIPAADLPLDYTGLSQLKITAAANNGTADAYFDTYSIDAATPETSPNEFVYRTSIISAFNNPTFSIFPSYEMGDAQHSNRFDFGITQPSQFVSYPTGSDGILPTQMGGYPGQLNHPGFTITDAEAVASLDKNADFVETRDPNHVADWDGVLQQGVQVIGTWSSDAHTGLTAGKPATYMYAPSLNFDDLMHSYFEGRVYNALNNFNGRVILNLDPASQEPFPARYPVYVSSAQTTANVHFQVTSSLYSGDRIIWTVNGTALPAESPSSGKYNVTKAVTLAAPTTYVRAEAQTNTGTRRAMSEAIFFVQVPSLPAGISYYVDGVTTADSRNYTGVYTKGITASSWDPTAQALSLTFTDPAQALVSTRITGASAPQGVTVDGVSIVPAASQTDFQAATNSAWYYDGSSTLYLKVLHANTAANAILAFTAQPPTTPTVTPTGAAATPTSTPVNTPTRTNTPIVVPTDTPTNPPAGTFTPTPTPSNTPAPTSTAINTPTPAGTGTPPTGNAWYESDTHVHSTVSGSAMTDIGLLAQAAQNIGLNVIFLTDHPAASTWPLGLGNSANRVVFDDALNGYWVASRYGNTGSTAGALATSPVLSGTNSLHMMSASTTYGESLVWGRRGPNFRSGDIILTFSVYPTRIDPGSGLDVSVSIGGDPTVRNPTYGYTTQGQVTTPGKSTVLIWQLGTTRTASSNPNARVITYPLTYTLNAWNSYTINVTQAMQSIPAADQPLDYSAITDIKMTAAGNHGTADGYFDAFSLGASSPAAPADEFVYRNSVIGTYDTSTFHIYPSAELGTYRQSQRFNYSISQPSQWTFYDSGNTAVLATQQTGYPAQLNCPGTCTPAQDVLNTQGAGADLLETREPGFQLLWDGILQQGTQILGTWSSDSHSGLSAGAVATYIYAPSIGFDDLMHSMFEGRTYLALNNFPGRISFNLDGASQEPFPARYPVYVPASQGTANVHLAVTSGLTAGDQVRWLLNGTPVLTDTVSGSSYDAVQSMAIGNARDYVRAEIRSSTGVVKGLTQPIFFLDLPGLPAGDSFNVDRVTNANGRGYTKISTKGITSTGWDSVSQALTLTLTNPLQALSDVLMNTLTAPTSVTVAGASAQQVSTRAAFQALTSSGSYYDSVAGVLYVRALQSSANTQVTLGFAGGAASTATPTSAVTSTPTVTPVPTTIPTNTPTTIPTNTPTYTPTSVPTNTPTGNATGTPTSTSAPTDTPAATATVGATNTATDTPVSTPTSTPPNTPTYTPTGTPTGTPTNTPTGTPSNTATNTPVNTPTSTPAPTNTPGGGPTPQILFSDGFETGGFLMWTGSSGNGRPGSKAEVINPAAYSGAWGAHLNNGTGGVAGSGPYRSVTFPVPSNHVVSSQMRVEINSAAGAGTLRIIHLRDETRAKSVARIQYSGGVWQLYLLLKNGSATTANFNTAISPGAWHLLEITYDWSTAQPVANAYLDGVLQATITDTTTGSNYNINSTYFLTYEDITTATTDVYFDDAKVANGYVGGP